MSKRIGNDEELSVDVSLMAELKLAFRKAGIKDREWTSQRIKRLVEKPELLTDLLRVLSGQAQIAPIKHLVNLRKNPPYDQRAPSRIYEHRKGGRRFELDFTKIGFLRPRHRIHYDFLKKQFTGELEDLCVCNATLLDYIIGHCESGLIPDEIRLGQYQSIAFLGTTYFGEGESGFADNEDEIDDDPTFFVRTLCWDNCQGWFWSWKQIDKLDPNNTLIAYHIQ